MRRRKLTNDSNGTLLVKIALPDADPTWSSRSPLRSRVWLFRLVIIASFCGDPLGHESRIRDTSRRQGRAQGGPGAR